MNEKESKSQQESKKQVKNNTISNLEKDEIPTFTRKVHSLKQSDRRKNARFKPIIIAVSSALSVGFVLGFIMLHFITNIGEETRKGENHASVHADTIKASSTDDVSLSKMNAYVLQAGVFSEKENAKEWQDNFLEAGFETIIWERDDQYYLFAGITDTEEQAKILKESFAASHIDVFIKEWLVEGQEIRGDVFATYLKDFSDVWISTLQSYSEEKEILMKEWEGLYKQGDTILEYDSPLIDKVAEMVAEIDADITDNSFQIILIDLWKAYEKSME